MPLDTKNSGDPSPHSRMTVERAPQSRGRLMAFLFGLAILHGSLINLMPVMFSTMAATFHVDKTQQGMLKSCFFAGLMVSLVVSGYLTRYLGARRMTILAGIVAGAGAMFFGLAPTYTLVLVAAGVLATGIAPFTAVYAAVIAANFPHTRQRMYMWTYGFLAGSATIATTSLGALLDIVPRYNPLFVLLGLSIWAWMTLLVSVSWRALDETAETMPSASPDDAAKVGPREKLVALWRFLTSGIFSRGALYVMGLLMVFDYLCASNMMAWTPSFFEELYHGGSLLGGTALSASSAGVCVGRILMGALPPGRIPERVLLALCYLGVVVSFGAIVFFCPPYIWSIGLMFGAGAFISAQAPTMGSLAVAKFGDRAPVVIPLCEAFGAIGGLLGPPLLGLLAMRAGALGAVMWLVPAAGLALSAVAIGWEVCDRHRGVPDLCSAPATKIGKS
jgi:MFS family permease